MRPIEHCVEEEPVIKKARMINTVENVPLLSRNEGNEQAPLIDMEEKKETCVASIAVEEGKDICVEQHESNERKIEEASALSLADQKHVDLEMEVKEVDTVSGDANVVKLPFLELEKENEASVTGIEETPVVDSCVASGGMKEEIGSNPLVVLRKKLLVLDLNGLLAAIVSPLADCKADINIGRRAIFKRPFCEDFLNFCFDKFEVGIWSSRKKNNVDRITEFLLGDMKSKLLFCWDMAYCSTTSVGSLENRHKFVVFKDLNQLWEKHDPTLPWKKGDYNETNTVLLDDSPYKAMLNPPYTAIFPQSYNHQDKTDASLGNGGDLRLHMEKLVEAENVQDFIKKNPFGQAAITEASESWDFYRQAIGNVRERKI
uniref:Mitochondrial import inner membrane translocase subunit TIM50 n=1 Tax=Noccaea caerulescens TaxID=107243 RepID=A0A1J3FGR7_NOCCA